VFASTAGTELDAANVRRAFRQVVARAGLDPADWTPRELRHSFVSLLSDHGVSIEKIADLVGHSGTIVTEKVYRHQLRPVLLTGTVVMDHIFDGTLPGPATPPAPAKRPGPRR
jgi:site-specific recombinase XerD